MHQNKLKLNNKKTEFIIFGTETSLKKVQTAHIRVGTHIIERVDHVRNIGAIFDEQMRMEKQVGQLCKSAWLYLYKINKIWQYLITDQVETIVHAFVTTKLDLNNSLLHNTQIAAGTECGSKNGGWSEEVWSCDSCTSEPQLAPGRKANHLQAAVTLLQSSKRCWTSLPQGYYSAQWTQKIWASLSGWCSTSWKATYSTHHCWG